MKKTLLTLAAAALTFASATASAAFIPFTVNEGVVPGSVANTFAADNFTGKYDEILGITGPGTFSASAVGTVTAYANGGNPLIGTTQLNLGDFPVPTGYGYKMYALFKATGNQTGPATFEGTGGELELWLDPSMNSTFNLTSFTSLATVNNQGDDIKIGSSISSYGSGDLIGPPGAFNIYFEQFTLTPFGQTYWTGINTLNFVLQTNGDIDGVTPNPATSLPPFFITGDFSANFALPEPTSMALVGVALLGLGFGARRRQAK